MGGIGSGRVSVEEIKKKVCILRRITGGKPFAIKDLPRDIHKQLDYTNERSHEMLIYKLAAGTLQCGRHLTKIGPGRFDWIDHPANVEPEEPASPQQVAMDLTMDEKVALDMVRETLGESQGAISLAPKMVAMGNDEFVEFAEKLESVKAAFKRGQNERAAGGYVWGIARDKFHDFYQIALAVRLGQNEPLPQESSATMPESPVEPPPAVRSHHKATKPSTVEKLSAALCEAAAKEIADSDKRIKGLEVELAQVREARAEAVRRFNLYRHEHNKFQK